MSLRGLPACTRFVRRVLLRFRTLSLTGPGGVLEGMPVDFAIWLEDMPDEPEDSKAGRDLPEAVMRVLCADLDRMEEMSSTETRVATELLIDTGRRPDEIYTPAFAFFAALCLRYALLAHGSENADDSVSCGHAALTAMGMLDQNVAGAGFLAEEQRLQYLSLRGDASGLWDASVTAGQERFRAVLGRLPR